jgi:hypothetical protein
MALLDNCEGEGKNHAEQAGCNVEEWKWHAEGAL